MVFVMMAFAAVLLPLVVFLVIAGRERALTNAMFTAEKEKRLGDAEAAARKLLGIRPRFAAYHADLARILEKQGRLKDALWTYRGMLEKRSFSYLWTKERIFENILRLQFALKDYPEAFKTAWSLVKYNPANVEGLVGLGRIYAGQGRLEEARDHLEEAVRHRPDHASARFFLGLCLLDMGDAKGGVENLERAYQLNPADPNTVFFLAAVYRQVGRFDRAGQLLAKIGVRPEQVPERVLKMGILAQDMPKIDLEFLKGRGRDLKERRLRPRTVEEFLALSGEEFRTVLLGILGRMRLTVEREECRSGDASEWCFVCRDGEGHRTFVAFYKTQADLGPIPLTEVQNRVEETQATRGVLICTSELTPQAREYAEKDKTLKVIDRSQLSRYL